MALSGSDRRSGARLCDDVLLTNSGMRQQSPLGVSIVLCLPLTVLMALSGSVATRALLCVSEGPPAADGDMQQLGRSAVAGSPCLLSLSLLGGMHGWDHHEGSMKLYSSC